MRSRLRNAEVAARRLVGRRCSRATESATSAYSPATGEAAAADDVHDEVEDGDNDSGDGAEGEGQRGRRERGQDCTHLTMAMKTLAMAEMMEFRPAPIAEKTDPCVLVSDCPRPRQRPCCSPLLLLWGVSACWVGWLVGSVIAAHPPAAQAL